MSDKKQSSVDYAVEKLEKLIPHGNQIIISLILEQAKAMHKEEIRKTINDTQETFFHANYESFDEYYNETYGGNNE